MELANEEFKDFMLDIETLGTRPGDAIISIGGVLFDRETKTIGLGFRANLDIEQVMAAGFGATGGTIKWWFEQSNEARAQTLEDPMPLTTVLMALAGFLTQGEDGVNEDIKVWGNGAAFDNVLLREMYQRLGLQEPWRHWNDRCFRTMRAEHDQKKVLQPDFDGERHNAFADAMHQAKWLINIHHNERVFAEVEPSYVGQHEEESE